MEKVGDISDLLQGKWEIRKDRTGGDTGELVCGDVAYISVRLMGRAHADEAALARVILERLAVAPPTASD